MYVIGLMSGTSTDGIDAALVDITVKPELNIELIAFDSVAYSAELKAELRSVMPPNEGTIEHLTYLHYYLGKLFGEFALKLMEQADLGSRKVELVASHGQTIRNLPPKNPYFPHRCRLQIADTAVIAEITGVPTIGDFRPAEVAAGGEGAPLIANFDYHMFRSPEHSKVALNIGGISNITYLPAGGSIDDVLAFDVGPGNMIIDEVVHRITSGEKAYDHNGLIAARGRTNQTLLEEMLKHPFINLKPPKSAGREEFGVQFVNEVFALAQDLNLTDDDLVATVTELTAEAINLHCKKYLEVVEEIVVGGGGGYNKTLLKMLQAKMDKSLITTTADYGIPTDAKEAIGFAFLGFQAFHRRPNNVPSATGASHPVIMGKLSWAKPS